MSAATASSRLDDIAPPTPPFLVERSRSSSRPLSEISDNSELNLNRRSVARSFRSDNKSRPVSEIRDDVGPSSGTKDVKKMSTPQLQTITLNLNDYAALNSAKAPTTPVTASSSSTAPPPPSPSTKPAPQKPEKPPALASRKSSSSVVTSKDIARVEGAGDKEDGEDHVSPMLMAKRASLRPSPLSFSYADVAKPTPSPPLMTSTSISSSVSSNDFNFANKPLARTKPSWLRRASGTAALRSKSKSPANEEGTLTASSSLPPALPPRKGSITPSESLEQSSSRMLPPDLPWRGSYANIAAAAGPSRSRLGDGQGRPASAQAPPPLPSRENVGNIRNRLAAWTQAAQSSSTFSRSDSSASLASIAGPSTSSGFTGQPRERVPSSAQRALGHAGSAVQKSWAGLRARGVAGSISSMSGIGQSVRRGSLEPSGSWSSGLARRGSRDRTQSADVDLRGPSSDGPVFIEGVIKRKAGDRTGKVFGRDLETVGRIWGVADIGTEVEGLDEYEKAKRACLPAVVIRAIEYLELWGPKEEGIFRISGRTSHISRLRKEFDAGADLDLRQCHPADLDPHAVSGIFKSYLRELPAPLLTTALTPRFDAYVWTRDANRRDGDDDLPTLLALLPIAHWYLLAEIVKLLELIPKHTASNRMTLNALMLSLGPSLNISGGVLTELLEKRAELFAHPPSAHGSLTTGASLIDFGETNIAPPNLPSRPESTTRSTTPASMLTDDGASQGPPAKKKGPKLPQKPSITRLFSVASGLSSSTKIANSESPPTSAVAPEPPRVDVSLEPISPLPTFTGSLPPETLEHLREVTEPGEEVMLGSLDVDPIQPPLTPTPIADRFSSQASSFPSLRAKSGSGSVVSAPASRDGSPGSGSTNPATVIRREAPGFFSSANSANNERHARSYSATPSLTTTNATNGSGLAPSEFSEQEAARSRSLGPEEKI